MERIRVLAFLWQRQTYLNLLYVLAALPLGISYVLLLAVGLVLDLALLAVRLFWKGTWGLLGWTVRALIRIPVLVLRLLRVLLGTLLHPRRAVGALFKRGQPAAAGAKPLQARREGTGPSAFPSPVPIPPTARLRAGRSARSSL